MFTVGDVMTKGPRAIGPDDSLGMASDLLAMAHVRHLPVVSEGTLVGVLSQRDLIRAVANRPGEQVADAEVRTAMSVPPLVVRPDTPLRRAARLLLRLKIGCLPVLDRSGALVGILTESDLAMLATELIKDLDRAELGWRRGLGAASSSVAGGQV